MSLDLNAILTPIQTFAQGSGAFESVLLHEPKNAPGQGITLAVWVDLVRPVLSSGVDNASMLVIVNLRAYLPFLSAPEDAIDAALWTAVDPIVADLVGDFTLGGAARNVDVFGENGTALEAVYGYLNQDGTVFRVVEVPVPVVVNDCYQEGA